MVGVRAFVPFASPLESHPRDDGMEYEQRGELLGHQDHTWHTLYKLWQVS